MKTKLKTYRNGWLAMFEKTASHDAPYTVLVRDPCGEVYDRMRCDNYRAALDYWLAFNAIAKRGLNRAKP